MDEKTTLSTTAPRESNWLKVIFYIYVHILMSYGIILAFAEAYFSTILFSGLLIFLSVLGVVAGAHRLWAHRSYTAVGELRVFLMLCQTLAGQGTIYDWVLYHRLHHKHFNTHLDPFNPSKGFFYSHLLCLTKVPLENEKKLKRDIDMSDMQDDSIVMFQKKYYWLLLLFVNIFLPIYITYGCWDESFLCSILVVGWMRYGITLHFTWLIHSASTILGLQRGEKFPSDTNWVFLFYKTHWIKFHYIAPWDYQAGEYGKYGNDWVSMFIRVCAALELASNLRIVDTERTKDAIYLSMKTKKPLSQCLLESNVADNIPVDHYQNLWKYLKITIWWTSLTSRKHHPDSMIQNLEA